MDWTAQWARHWRQFHREQGVESLLAVLHLTRRQHTKLGGASNPFFHGDPDDVSPPDGTCKGMLPDKCISYLEGSREADFLNTDNRQHRIRDHERCPGIGAATRLDMGSPFNLTKRGQDDAAMKYNEGRLVSFASGAHPKGNETDHAAHGSQYAPILFRWMRTDEEGLRYDEPKPKGRIASLMCVVVNKAAEGKELQDPGEDYLEAMDDKEAGKLFVLSRINNWECRLH